MKRRSATMWNYAQTTLAIVVILLLFLAVPVFVLTMPDGFRDRAQACHRAGYSDLIRYNTVDYCVRLEDGQMHRVMLVLMQ